MHHPATVISLNQRDLRLDIVRGVALLVIFTDHLQETLPGLLTPINFGFSDMAEVFIFVSGYISALVYNKVLDRNGFRACYKKAALRAGQLYLAHVGTLLVVCAILSAFERFYPQASMDAGYNEFADFLESPWKCLVGIVSLTYLPGNFEILPLYGLFLLCLPPLLYLARQNGLLVFVVLLCLYLLVQLMPNYFCLPPLWRSVWLFNPLAWQIVFVFGAVAALGGEWIRIVLPRGLFSVAIAILIVEAAFFIKLFNVSWLLDWSGKANCEPLRVVHFWAVVILGRLVLSAFDQCALIRWWWPLVLCGQNALVTYCAGGVLSVVGNVALASQQYSLISQLTVNILGWSACILAAGTSARLKLNRRPCVTIPVMSLSI